MELINKITGVFPDRSLKVNKLKNEASSRQIGRVFCIFLCLLLGIYLAVDNYPDLIDDYKISRNPIVVDHNISGECKVRRLITSCSVKIYNDDSGFIEKNFSFFGNSKRYQVQVIAFADNPSLMTLDLAIKTMFSRFLIITALILAILWAIWLIIDLLCRARNSTKIIDEINGHKLKPVSVPVKLKFLQTITIAIYKGKDTQGKNNKYSATFNSKTDGGPIVLKQHSKKKYDVLGVISDNNPTPIILDENFSRCDFTDEEIRRISKILQEG
ncbi:MULTISPECIES: hypothetical protein [unclassified Snodgrassella]|uniref:hypothetical protein n=1 Tax=unclassified Snodgrassella TaxID=2625236 RepID=UPI0018DC628C|nr:MULTISPECIES: hypothetical protein [unclassified Snodgrassella]MBI0067208.1 hypothetical protein [Snodgrassella sp. M0110]MBI0075874.1 hypothetical protein [Snodgrassella sp. M0118]MBI0078509.1 hypothetical protein [Snodgrassella sp. M0112]